MEPKVAIIILNWNGVKDTLECIESVFKLNYSNFEIIVVDNGSTDSSVRMIRDIFPNVKLIENKENLGYTGGNNIGMHYAIEHESQYVWLLNNDTIVASDSLSEMIRVAGQFPGCGLLSPVIYYYDEPEKIQFCGTILDLMKHKFIELTDLMPKQETLSGRVIMLWGTALLIRCEAIMRIGFLNEKYSSYHEDMEYSLRSVHAGFTNLVVSTSRVYHKEASSSGGKESPLHCYYMTRNIHYFWRDHLRGWDQIRHLRYYLADSINWAGKLKKKNKTESADACLDGMWSALRGVTGPWDKNVKMPSLIRRFLLAYPFFLVHLFRGDFRGIRVKEIHKGRD